MTERLTEMVQPKATVLSDLDSRHEESNLLGCWAWICAIGACALLFVIVDVKIREHRADAEFQRRWDVEMARREALLQRMAKGTPEEQRIARELRGITR